MNDLGRSEGHVLAAHLIVPVLGLALGVLILVLTQGDVLAQADEKAAPRKICTVSDKRINEASGIAESISTPGSFWLHNDSGHGPVLYLIDGKGNTSLEVKLARASSRDWEDMASFDVNGIPLLLVADVGDNLKVRTSYSLYIVKEPSAEDNPETVPLICAMKFRYEDGSRNCESVAVDTQSGSIILVEKTNGPECGVYALPLTSKPDKELKAKLIAKVQISNATAMDISPDGSRAVVLTLSAAYIFTRSAEEDWPTAFSKKPLRIAIPRAKQAEAVCFSKDGAALFMTSEGENQPIWEIPLMEDKTDN